MPQSYGKSYLGANGEGERIRGSDCSRLGSKGHTHTSSGATHKAREAIEQLYGKDLLLDHKSKSIADVKLSDFSLILVMEKSYRNGLPEDRTYTLKEYAGLEGNVSDPFDKDIRVYKKCRDEFKKCLERAMNKIINDC